MPFLVALTGKGFFPPYHPAPIPAFPGKTRMALVLQTTWGRAPQGEARSVRCSCSVTAAANACAAISSYAWENLPGSAETQKTRHGAHTGSSTLHTMCLSHRLVKRRESPGLLIITDTSTVCRQGKDSSREGDKNSEAPVPLF